MKKLQVVAWVDNTHSHTHTSAEKQQPKPKPDATLEEAFNKLASGMRVVISFRLCYLFRCIAKTSLCCCCCCCNFSCYVYGKQYGTFNTTGPETGPAQKRQTRCCRSSSSWPLDTDTQIRIQIQLLQAIDTRLRDTFQPWLWSHMAYGGNAFAYECGNDYKFRS